MVYSYLLLKNKKPTSFLNKRLDVHFTRKSRSILSKDIIMSVFCWHTLSQCSSNYIYLNSSLTIILVNPKQKDYVVICYFSVLYSKFIMTYFQILKKVTNCINFIIKKLYIKKGPYNWDFINKIQPKLSYLLRAYIVYSIVTCYSSTSTIKFEYIFTHKRHTTATQICTLRS